MNNLKVYFPNLNGLRFFAAFGVVIHHIERSKYLLGLQDSVHPVMDSLGPLAVLLFFVLSGFLITYLLLVEKEQHDHIHIKEFYIRRILKIWPLYFFIMLLGFVILPQFAFFDVGNAFADLGDHYSTKFFLFLLFLPNIAMVVFPPVYYASQAWSIGAEEQFYLIWPWLVKKIKNIGKGMLVFIAVYFALCFGVMFIASLTGNENWNLVFKCLRKTKIDCMAIGGLGAWAVYKRMNILSFLFRKDFQLGLWIVCFAMIALNITIPLFTDELYAVIFCILIMNLAVNEKNILNLEYPALNYLGKISYGLYMYHPLAIIIILKTLMYLFPQTSLTIGTEVGIYILSTLLTIAISALSFRYFEKYFLSLKQKVSVIISGNDAKQNNQTTSHPINHRDTGAFFPVFRKIFSFAQVKSTRNNQWK